MAEPRVPEPDALGEAPVPRDVVERSSGDTCWSVAGCAWDGLDAALAEELAALLAPPIVVGAAAWSSTAASPGSAEPEPAEPAAEAEPAPAPEPAPEAEPAPEPSGGRHRRATLEMFVYRPEPPRREVPLLVPAPPRAAPGRHRRRG